MNYLDHQLKPQIESYLVQVISALTNQYTLQLAKDSVPIASIVQNHLDIVEKEGEFNENLLPHLVDWFANEFFTWFSPPNCSQCDKKLEYFHSSTNLENLRVEHYRCIDYLRCTRSHYQFIRHNDPAILLNTRQGRCGEWAMCFLVILKALDYEARIILDTTDHVWNEVWCESKQKWVHVDPCESVVDMPLLYELGWKKQLQYCIGLSNLEVIDVTARYTKNFSATMMTRPYCDCQALCDYLESLTINLLKSISDEDLKSKVLKRREIDLTFLRDVSAHLQSADQIENYGNRKTGSMQWRIERGEYNPIIDKKYIIIVDDKHSSQDILNLRYNCDRNSYDSQHQDLRSGNWTSFIYRAENIDFKYERDWKCSYLARYETCPCTEVGKIQWMFDVSKVKARCRLIKIKISGEVYPNTAIDVCVTSLSGCFGVLATFPMMLNKENVLNKEDLHLGDCQYVRIEALLAGGDLDDPVGWQKPQLFRQIRSPNSGDEWPFQISFH